MNKLIKYAIAGAIGYQIGQLVIKYRIVKNVLNAKLEEEKESKKEDEAQ